MNKNLMKQSKNRELVFEALIGIILAIVLIICCIFIPTNLIAKDNQERWNKCINPKLILNTGSIEVFNKCTYNFDKFGSIASKICESRKCPGKICSIQIMMSRGNKYVLGCKEA